MRISDWSSDVCSSDLERQYLKQIEKMTRVRCEIVQLPENFAEAVRNLHKHAPVRQGGRPEGQRAHGEGRGRPERAHRPDGVRPTRGGGARSPFRTRKNNGTKQGTGKRVGESKGT